MTPTFMAEDLPDAAPELGKLEVGDEILVVHPSYRTRNTDPNQPERAVVTSKARIWITAEQPYGLDMSRYRKSWRLRLDNQTDGGESNYAVRFYTPDQWRFRQALNDAERYLVTQGIRVEWDSPWKHRAIELARMVWRCGSKIKMAADNA